MKKISLTLLAALALIACKKESPAPATNTNATPTTPTSCNSAIKFGLELNNNYLDTSCNSKNATGVNTAFVNDRNGSASKAVSFNGTTSYLETPNDAALHPAFPFTVSFWVNPVDSASTSNQFFQSQIAGAYYGFWIQASSGTGQVAANFGDGTGASSGNRNSAVSSTKLRSNTWTHVTVIFNGYNNMQMYFNGVAESALTYSGSASSIVYLPSTTTTAKGRIGGYDGISTAYFNGKMDKVKIWSKALTNTEVTTEYNLTN